MPSKQIINSNSLDIKFLKEILDYDEQTGIFIWKKRNKKYFKSERDCNAWNTRFATKQAGYIYKNKNNYEQIYIRIYNKKYQASRLAYYYFYEKWPKYNIDHLNGDSLDNSILNLRDVSQKINCCNSKKRIDNTTGIAGVYWDNSRNKWVAEARDFKTGKKIFLGRFDIFEEAKNAREIWLSSQFYYTNRHGK